VEPLAAAELDRLAAANSWPSGPLGAGPLLGEVSGDGANIWVQGRDSSPLTLIVSSDDGEQQLVAQPQEQDFLCTVFRLRGLGPGQRYRYFLRSRHGDSDSSEFTAAPAADAPKLRLAFGSCFADYWTAELPIFSAIRRDCPQAMVMLGDNCYFAEPDWQSEPAMMLAHLRSRNNPSFRRLAASTPMLAIYDDHDFGPNDSNGHFVGRDLALRSFQRMWGQASYGLADCPGIFSSVRLGPVELFLTDGRYHRAVGGDTVLGPAQLDWLLDGLRRSQAPIKVVASGSVLLGRNPFYRDWESWLRSAPADRERLLSTIEHEAIAGVVFISGDLHFAQVTHLPGRSVGGARGPELWEVTSSPLGIAPEQGKILLPDSARVCEIPGRYNYGLLEIDLDRSGAELLLLLKGSEGEVLYRQPVDLKTLRTGQV
jgi:alkaline phosphatase D